MTLLLSSFQTYTNTLLQVIPPRKFPEGTIKLLQINPDGTKTVLEERTATQKARMTLQQKINESLMLNPTLQFILVENNAIV